MIILESTFHILFIFFHHIFNALKDISMNAKMIIESNNIHVFFNDLPTIGPSSLLGDNGIGIPLPWQR